MLLHQPSSEGGGQASDIEIQAREILRTRVLLERMLAEHTGRDEEQVRADIERDKILTAEEAVAYGLVDRSSAAASALSAAEDRRRAAEDS